MKNWEWSLAISCIKSCFIHGNEICIMKAEHEVRLETKEVSMIRWICRFTLQERELHRMEPINLVIKRGRLMWFGR